MLFQRSITILLRAEFQTENAAGRNDDRLLIGHSDRYAADSGWRFDYCPGDHWKPQPDLHSRRIPHDFAGILDSVGARHATSAELASASE